MPRDCHPLCLEKRDFMQVNPPRKATDFYRDYDPWIGIGTAVALCLFFFVITVKSCVRYGIRRTSSGNSSPSLVSFEIPWRIRILRSRNCSNSLKNNFIRRLMMRRI
ncbi:unnamed protein product [Caenorhabditis auriculariae]|uniref:FXYD domain-containing ion transport regulator n=1 Tax=Caenorhabditis auriculariae TaxID=2777116 RepID=A0A8S1HUA4_9PELO|nr:unnamed protein product [Caenorhabditis auriculariae]